MLALCGLGSAWAQTAPDAGRVLRDLQQTPALPPPQAVPQQRSEESPAPSQPGEAKVLVKSVTLSGNQEIPTEQLQPLVADLVGTEQTLGQLSAAARRITAYYRRAGFAVARAYLPAQDITHGNITIGVVEGRIAGHQLRNQSLLSNERAEAYLDGIREGDVIMSAQIDRGLLLLQDTPGVSGSRATLQPGASVGMSELLVEVDPAQRYSGNVVLDNYGSRYTGEYRVGGSFNVASPLQIGDQLSASALTSGDNLDFERLAYQLPVGSDGLRVGAAYFETHYKLGREFASLQAHGSATSSSLFATYPFIRSQLKNLSGTLSVEDKRLQDAVDSTSTFTPKKVSVASLGLSGSLQDFFWGGGTSSLDLSLAQGSLSIDSASAVAIDDASARTNGGYTRFSYGLNRLQRLTDAAFLAVAVNGQTASKNLDSSEKFSLGGANGVRAYPQGEANGDEGYRATVELHYTLTADMQATLFYDMGTVTINKNPFGTSTTNSRTLAGAGVGLNANLVGLQWRAALAWPSEGGPVTSVPASTVTQPTLWLQVAMAF